MDRFYQQKLSQGAQADSSNLDSTVIFINVSPVDDTCFNDDFSRFMAIQPVSERQLDKQHN